MEKRTKEIIFASILSGLLLVIISLVIGGAFNDSTDNPIGGQKDSYGCLGPAGYSWNSTTGTCVRQWQLSERIYQGKTSEECAQINPICNASYVPFSDNTGCGCELEYTTQS